MIFLKAKLQISLILKGTAIDPHDFFKKELHYPVFLKERVLIGSFVVFKRRATHIPSSKRKNSRSSGFLKEKLHISLALKGKTIDPRDS